MTNNIPKNQLLNAINTNSDIVIDEGSLHLVISAYKIEEHHARAKGEFQLAIMAGDVEINNHEVKIDSEDYDISATELTDAHVDEVNDWVDHFRALAAECNE